MHALDKLRPLALLLLRLALGVIFIYNGYPKLMGNARGLGHIFSRGGFSASFPFFSGGIEFFGGAMLIVGIFTRIAALAISCELAAGLWRAHHLFSNPAGVSNYQFPLACCVGAFALATFGPGLFSLDPAMFGAGGRGAARKAKARD